MFYHNLEISDYELYPTFQVNGVVVVLDEERLCKIFSVPTIDIKFIKREKKFAEFLFLCSVVETFNTQNFNKRVLKGELQLLLELVIGEVFPRSDTGSTLTDFDLFLMETLFKLKKVNLPAIVIVHINTVINAKARRHALPYGFWLNRMFAYFNKEFRNVKADSMKRVFGISTLEKNKRILRMSDGKFNSLLADLMDKQKHLNGDI
ncbi:hypothetical protein FXO37_19235 [Capsicum annuum]|nr:hypothetical protein FXO37_19235 [Capsicum annuum]